MDLKVHNQLFYSLLLDLKVHISWKKVHIWTSRSIINCSKRIFQNWLPRPNHYAHEICIEILCRTPVSILKYLSPWPQNHMKNSKYSFLAWMSTWISRWRRRRRRRRRADNFLIWPDPHPIAHRDEISRSGIPHFDFWQQPFAGGAHVAGLLAAFRTC